MIFVCASHLPVVVVSEERTYESTFIVSWADLHHPDCVYIDYHVVEWHFVDSTYRAGDVEVTPQCGI